MSRKQHKYPLLTAAMVALASAGCPRSDSPDVAEADRESPSRIVALAPSSAEILCALGEGDRLVGVSSYITYPPSIANKPRIGGLRDPDYEAILGLEPDLVILRGLQEKLERLCQSRDIAIYHDPTETLPDLYRGIRELSTLVGRQPKGERLIDEIERGLADVRRSAANLPPTPVLLTMRSPDRLADITTVSDGSHLHGLIELAGGRNIFADEATPYPHVRVESVVARSPEVIIELMPDLPPSLTDADIAGQWETLPSVPAVRAGRIHVIRDDHLLIPSPRVVTAARTLLRLLHPDTAEPPPEP